MRVDRAKEGTNSIVVADREYLLAEVGVGYAIHLVGLAVGDLPGEPAVPARWLDPTSVLYIETAANYDPAALLAPRWAPQTLCGRKWDAMAAGPAGPLVEWREVALAPSCRRCLTSIDRLLPPPAPDEPIEALCALIVHAVEEYGSAEVTGVPGDQMNTLRAAARARVRQKLGYGSRTYAFGHHVVIDCPEAGEQEQVRQRNAHLAAAAIEAVASGAISGVKVRIDDSVWRLSWRLLRP